MHASHAQVFRPLRETYSNVRATTLKLSEPFSAEDQMLQSMPDASPMKWHAAHTTWFFETFLLSGQLRDYSPFDSRYKHLFNSYYKQLGSHPYRGSRGLMSRPSLEEVHAYRAWVDEAMESHFDQLSEAAGALMEIGINHEQQHQELIVTDIKHALWSMPLRPEGIATGDAAADALFRAPGTLGGPGDPRLHWTSVDGGIYEVGHAGGGFAFDNEGPRHEILLQPFQIASRQVTNAEYLEFMRDNGYYRPELWLSDGWDAVCAHGWNSPLYWEQRDGDWWEFSFQGMRKVDGAAPVCHISYFEADAFARWSGARLPREEEWEVVASAAGLQQSGAFLENGGFHPEPAPSDSPHWFGNVWEWTASPYVAYPGFVPAAGVIGEYNGKFMCNQLVLRGGSCATPRSHIRATYRNFFPPHARWQFMGIRLAK
ncbi:MAG TPA: ergothioneine biosynthesis protein EgtB [Terriglobales bacterium]